MENWRKFLIEEQDSSSTIKKLIKLQDDAKSLVKKSIKEIESKHGTEIKDYHLGHLLADQVWHEERTALVKAHPGYHRKHRRKMQNQHVDLMNDLYDAEPKLYDRASRKHRSPEDPKYKAELAAYKTDKEKKMRTKEYFDWSIHRALVTEAERINDKISNQYTGLVGELLKVKRKKKSDRRIATHLIPIMFAIEKGLDPGKAFGNAFSINTEADPFTELESKSVAEATANIGEVKSSPLYGIIWMLLPKNWDKAVVSMIKIICHLIRQKFSSSGVTFMGTGIKTPSYQFISDILSGEIAEHMAEVAGIAMDSHVAALDWLKFNDGDKTVKEIVKWLISNQKPTLDQCVAQVDKVLESFERAGYREHAMYKSVEIAKKAFLNVLG